MRDVLAPPQSFLKDAEALGIRFESDDCDRLGRFLALLFEANQRFNLTSITDPEEAWSRHILDSLTLLPYIVQSGATSVIDIGSGGGLPGIPLAIVAPEVSFTLLEATEKKARYLRSAGEALKLDNVQVVNERAEVAARDREAHREQYDLVIARAVGRLPVLIELTVPFARVGGHVLAIKGQRAAEEVAESRSALHKLHAVVVDANRTPTGTIVVIEKQRRTPKLYPRRPGEPKRNPLS